MASRSVIFTGTVTDLDYFCDAEGYEQSNLSKPQTKLEFFDNVMRRKANESAIAGKSREENILKQENIDSYSPGF